MDLSSYPDDTSSLGLTIPICIMKGYLDLIFYGAMNSMCDSCVSDM